MEVGGCADKSTSSLVYTDVMGGILVNAVGLLVVLVCFVVVFFVLFLKKTHFNELESQCCQCLRIYAWRIGTTTCFGYHLHCKYGPRDGLHILDGLVINIHGYPFGHLQMLVQRRNQRKQSPFHLGLGSVDLRRYE